MKSNQSSFSRANRALQENKLHMALELYDEAIKINSCGIKAQILVNQKIALSRLAVIEKEVENKKLILNKIKHLTEARDIYNYFDVDYYIKNNQDWILKQKD